MKNAYATRHTPKQNNTTKFTSKAVNTGKSATHTANKFLDRTAYNVGKKAEKIMIPFNNNILPNLSPEQHRLALIESCVNTNEIFKDKITDPPNKGGDDIRDYMFYNQLFFLATAQAFRPNQTGSLLPGLAGGISMIAAAAIVSEDFRKNMTEHIQDTMLKYTAPFQDSAPKLWQKLSAHVESHPGCVSPESIALKLMRYQKQAYEMVKNNECSAKFADDLLMKKTSELKSSADGMNIEWSDVVRMRDSMSKDMNRMQSDRMAAYGDNWQTKTVEHKESLNKGLSETTGGAYDWKATSDWEVPIDVKSVARKLKSYQKQLQEAVEELNGKSDGENISSKYSDLAGKTESEYFAAYVKKVAELKSYSDQILNVDWNDVAEEYDSINKAEYDTHNKNIVEMNQFIDEPNRHKYLPDGSENPDFGKPNDTYYQALDKQKEAIRQMNMTNQPIHIPFVPKLNDGVISDYVKEYDAIEKHNKHMYYELPVDADSAGRCLKKYQQEAYGCVRDMPDTVHEQTDSATAYNLANDLCKNVRASADVLGFDWSDSVKAYRKDVYTTVLKNPNKATIWSEMTNGDVIANIPKSTTTYTTSDGHTVKKTKMLNPKEQIEAWDGVLFNADGTRVDDNVLMQVRNPYSTDEAAKALYNLFVDDFKLQLQSASIRQEHSTVNQHGEVVVDKKYQRQIDAINDERVTIEKRRDDLLDAFTSDHFSSDLIDSVELTAMKWFEDAKDKMREKSSLDESLSPKEPLGLPESNHIDFDM